MVTFYPRWDFLILAKSISKSFRQIRNTMSDGEWKPNVIVRVGKGSDKPLDPGHQQNQKLIKCNEIIQIFSNK